MKRKIHLASMRLLSNAGIDFPLCYSNAKLLDMDKSALPTAVTLTRVTCKHCRRIARANNSAYINGGI